MPTRFPRGVNNVDPTYTLSQYGLPDPSSWHTYFDDFDYYVAGDWTITNAATGTIALTDADGGVLLVTNNTSDDNAIYMDKKGESFLLESGKKAFFKSRFKVSDATETDFVIGLQITDSSPLDATDGIFFMKEDGDTQLDVYCRKDASTGSTSATNIATVVSDTYMTVGWYYDGKQTLTYFVNEVALGSLSASSTYLPDTELTVSFGVVNGSIGAKSMSIDYILAAKER